LGDDGQGCSDIRFDHIMVLDIVGDDVPELGQA
jgi:hypothetical protein